MRGASLRELLSAAVALIYPEICQVCHRARAGPRQSFVCDRCRASIHYIEPPYCDTCGQPYSGDITIEFKCSNCADRRFHFRHARAAVIARHAMLDLIHLYKYKQALWVEPLLVDLLTGRAAGHLRPGDWDCLVPVPLHPVKQRERGYNQASRLAGHLSRRIGIPVREDLLQRSRPTPSQTRLNRHEREENMRNAFRFRGSGDVDGQRIVLVDDVFTTGATTNACARVLRQFGARDVCVWTLARGT